MHFSRNNAHILFKYGNSRTFVRVLLLAPVVADHRVKNIWMTSLYDNRKQGSLKLECFLWILLPSQLEGCESLT